MLKLFFRVLLPCTLLLPGCQFTQDHRYYDDSSTLSAQLHSINSRPVAVSAIDTMPQHTAHDDRKLRYDDQALSHEILAALISQQELKQAHIKVVSYFGDVLLVGEVPNQESMSLAQNITASFDHVKSIKSSLTVGQNLSQSQQAQDSITNTKIKATIAQLDIGHAHLNITTNNNRVFVLGPLTSEQQLLIQDHLSTVPEVQKVYFY